MSSSAPVLQLVLTWGSRTWKFFDLNYTDSGSTLSASPDGGRADGVLAPIDIEEVISLYGADSAPTDQAIPIEVAWPGLTELLRDGELDWADWTAALYLDDVLILAGHLEDPQWDERGLSASVSLRLSQDAGTCLPPSWVATTTHWPAIEGAGEGRAYPLVVGAPSVYTGAAGAARAARGSPGIGAWASGGEPYLVVVAGHPVQATTLYVENEDLADIELLTVSTQTDALGQQVAACDCTAQMISSGWTLAHRYWVWWPTAGGIQGHPDIRGAGDLLLHLLARSSLPVDLPAWEGIRSRANAYRISGYIDDPSTSVWEWISSALLPLLPLTTTLQEGLLRPIWWEWLQTLTPTRTLIEGESCSRVGPVRLAAQGGGLASTLTLSWAPDASTGDYLRRRTLSGDPAHEGLTDHWCLDGVRQSWRRYGPRRLELESAYVGDQATADLILQRIAAARALPRLEVEVEVWDTSRPLYLGQAVSLTLNPALLPAARTCLVTSLRRSAGGLLRAGLVSQRPT